MSKIRMKIWGRVFDLDAIYDCYEGEEVLFSQKKALSNFVDNSEAVENALPFVKKYCLADENMKSTSIDNIFKYVMPKMIFVVRPKSDEEIVLLICDYLFDIEHDLTIMFENGKYKMIDDQSGLLA